MSTHLAPGMRRVAALALLACAALATAAGHASSPGDTSTPDRKHVPPKASSLAPHTPPANHAYGAPIEPPILKSRVRHKPHQTRSPPDGHTPHEAHDPAAAPAR